MQIMEDESIHLFNLSLKKLGWFYECITTPKARFFFKIIICSKNALYLLVYNNYDFFFLLLVHSKSCHFMKHVSFVFLVNLVGLNPQMLTLSYILIPICLIK